MRLLGSSNRSHFVTVFLFLIAIEVVLFCFASERVSAQTQPRFRPVVTYDSGGNGAYSIAVGDLNDDGNLDLVVANKCIASDIDTCPNYDACFPSGEYCAHGAVAVLLGNKDGTFQPPVTYQTTGYLASSVGLGDLNGDGKLDIVVVNTCGTPPEYGGLCPYGTVDILSGNGDGTFSPSGGFSPFGWYPVSVAVGDLDGDGKADIVVAETCYQRSTCDENGCTCATGSISVVLSNGHEMRYDSGLPWGRSVELGDMNGDHKLDVLVANDGGVGVLLNKKDGTFPPAVAYQTGGAVVRSVTSGDVNADGKSDILVANQCIGFQRSCMDGQAAVLLGNGDGTFRTASTSPSGGQYAISIAVGDVNGDGKPDLIVGDGNLKVLPGNGDGSFQSAISFASGNWPWSVKVADLNADGKPDVVFANGGAGVLLNDTPFCTAPPTITISAMPRTLWPPSGKMVPITVSGTITETGCTITAAAYAVSDEYGKVQPSGPLTLGPDGAYSVSVWLEASRLGSDLDGRSYRISIGATNNALQTGSKTDTVVVLHDQRR
jgi:hypothetical protein